MALVNLVPTMTSLTAPEGVVSSSDSNNVAYLAFDKSTGHWAYNDGYWLVEYPLPGWIQYEFESSKVVTAYAITAALLAASQTNTPKSWTLKASNTGAFSGEEVTLDTQTNITGWTSGERKEYSFANSTAYKYYRFTVTAGNHTYDIFVDELEFLGTLVPKASLTATVLLSAKSKAINKASASATVTISSTANRKKFDYGFLVVGEIQLASIIKTFRVVGEIEQPAPSIIIKRVNA